MLSDYRALRPAENASESFFFKMDIQDFKHVFLGGKLQSKVGGLLHVNHCKQEENEENHYIEQHRNQKCLQKDSFLAVQQSIYLNMIFMHIIKFLMLRRRSTSASVHVCCGYRGCCIFVSALQW